MNVLSLWRFQQHTIVKKATSHWALIYEEPDNIEIILENETHIIDDRIQTCFHISRNNEGKTAQFEQCSVNEDRWKDKIIDMRPVGTTNLSRPEFEKVCRKVTKEFIFRKIKNNCQNWCEAVLNEIGLESPVTPSNRECCGCLYLINLSSTSGSIIHDKIKSQN